jgi:regulator of RNase E activity RraA
MTIRPGDIVHADANGAIVIPTEIARRLVELGQPFVGAERA